MTNAIPQVSKPKAQPGDSLKSAPPARQVRMIRAVYGRMVDPHTGLAFDLKPCELFKMTPWVQCQIDAGKLILE